MNTQRIQIRKIFALFTLPFVFILTTGIWAVSVQAYDCVLDTNGDGIGDGTAGASSSNNSLRVACGQDATVSASFSTAVGTSSTASGVSSVALGNLASAIGEESTALGREASAAGAHSTAVGKSASAAGIHATAVGYFASAAGFSTALGRSASAAGLSSTALGVSASAAKTGSTALGDSSSAAGDNSIAVGYFASSAGFFSTAVGDSSSAAGVGSTVLGQTGSASGDGSSAIGQDADIDATSNDAIALGHDAKILNAPGAIAIGADLDGDGTGATATAAGAIAIGADVVADKANTMTVGVPIEIVRDDGSSNILVEETNATVAVRTLGELANNGGVRLRFNNMALGEEWDFTSNQSGGFQFSLVGSGGAELSVATNGTIRMGPGPISNLTLFPSGNMTIEGVLTENSDRDSKQDIKALNLQAILDKVANLPIQEWEYKDSPDQRHIGPMAQDFYETFQLGNDNTHIATLDMAGVALASIQALQKENDLKSVEMAKLKNENTKLKAEIEHINAKLLEIDRALSN